MKKNGFTLIELLAVIVILAIIALIATPIILGIINDARNESEERSMELYKSAIKQSIANYSLKNPTKQLENGVYEMMDNGSFCKGTITNGTCEGTELEVNVENTKPTMGTISIENGEIYYGTSVLINDKNFVYDGEKFVEATRSDCFDTTENEDGTITINEFICGPNVGMGGENKNTNEINDITDIVIPGYINGKRVTRIADGEYGSFAYREITSIILPNTLNYIGSSAFEFNNLTKIILPNGLTEPLVSVFKNNNISEIIFPSSEVMLDATFTDNQIKDLVMPANVTMAYEGVGYTFLGNPLEKLTFDHTHFYSYGSSSYTFDDIKSITITNEQNINYEIPEFFLDSICGNNSCSSLKELNLAEGLTKIGYNGFCAIGDASLVSFKLPNSLTYIDSWAFQFFSTPEKPLIIPKNVEYIAKEAFYNFKGTIHNQTGRAFDWNGILGSYLDYERTGEPFVSGTVTFEDGSGVTKIIVD